MKFNLHKSIAKFSNIDAIFWSAPGLLRVLFPASAAIAFSFGFGVDGTSGLASIAGITAVLLGIYAITVYLRNRKLAASGAESEEK